MSLLLPSILSQADDTTTEKTLRQASWNSGYTYDCPDIVCEGAVLAGHPQNSLKQAQ
jgi:hypothetical protein